VKGYQTIDAGTGEEGVQLARERHPALVLMDIQLPGISGIDALGQLRADPSTRSIPVIAVTASVMAQERQKVMAAGFNGFQGKPISVRTARNHPRSPCRSRLTCAAMTSIRLTIPLWIAAASC
jgi:CheY-like chemotaxis protein